MIRAITQLLSTLFDHSIFTIELGIDSARLRSGKCPHRFLSDLVEMQALSGVKHGWIRGYNDGGRIRIAVSGGVPPNVQQRIRNLWGLYDNVPRAHWGNSSGPVTKHM